MRILKQHVDKQDGDTVKVEQSTAQPAANLSRVHERIAAPSQVVVDAQRDETPAELQQAFADQTLLSDDVKPNAEGVQLHRIPENMAHETPDQQHGVQASTVMPPNPSSHAEHAEDKVPILPLVRAPPRNGAEMTGVDEKAVRNARKALETGHPVAKVLAAKCEQMHGLTVEQVWD